ncbi:hypothetical protein ACHAW5_007569 [Stephanodiscus triporus]|uniref:Putative gamma-glutamylcyclotransferase n=1 Tax=Stephanodiscus triporus TaxID=2934178 RepID=A0ABD3QAE4_9STRA
MAHEAQKATTCFVYGTLMSPDVLRALLGRVPGMMPKAILSNHSRHSVLGRVYPGIIPTPAAGPTTDNAVEGILLLDITPLEMRRLDWFEEEGVDYKRSNVQVKVPSCSFDEDGKPSEYDDGGNPNVEIIKTNAYIWALGTSKLDLSRDWDYDMFLQKHLDWYLETTVKPCRIAIEKEIL